MAPACIRHKPAAPVTRLGGNGRVPVSDGLDQLLQQAKVWRAGEAARVPGIATGFPVLDALLPNRGWPATSLTEILVAETGVGALSLVLPALAEVSRTQWVVWVCPPHVPYAPALQSAGLVLDHLLIVEPDEDVEADADYRLWVFEQALRFRGCGVALSWLESVPHRSLRRLQLACEQGRTWGVMFRDESFAVQASPAALRLSLLAGANGEARVRVLKSQGGARARACSLDLGVR